MNIKPLLVLISEGGVLGTVKVLLLHPIPKGQVRSTGNFGAAWDPFFLKQNRYQKRLKWGWIPPYASQRWIKTETRRIKLGCRLQIPIS
jgi:hypothetical protein